MMIFNSNSKLYIVGYLLITKKEFYRLKRIAKPSKVKKTLRKKRAGLKRSHAANIFITMTLHLKTMSYSCQGCSHSFATLSSNTWLHYTWSR